MKKFGKFIILFLILIFCVGTLCACNGISKYGAKMYDKGKSWIKEDFLKENKTYGAYYDNGYSVGSESYIGYYDNESPRTRDFFIDSKEKLDEIFNEFPEAVNFDEEIIILHTFTTTVGHRNHVLKRVALDDGNLKIFFDAKIRRGICDEAMPGQKWLIVKMKKAEFSSVEFIGDYSAY